MTTTNVSAPRPPLSRLLGAAPDRLHGAIEEAGWSRPFLDAVARVADRPSVDAVVDRRPAPRLAPVGHATVSVVIPCYNYARYLGDAVGSVLSQDHADVEVIVVNDCSTDASGDVAEELASRDARVSVTHNARNLGHVRTFNVGQARATGDFVIRLDADDLLTPGSVARALAVFEEYPRVGLVYGHPRHFTSARPPGMRSGAVSWTVWKGQDWVLERCRRGTNCITTPEAVVRSSVLRQVGPLNENLRFAQDMEMWLRVGSVSDVGRVNDVDQALHRDHDASMSVNEGAGLMTDLLERRQVFVEMFSAQAAEFEDPHAFEALFRRTLAVEALRHAAHFLDRGRGDDETVEALLAFALDTDSQAADLAELRRVERRRTRTRLRPRGAALVRATGRRLSGELEYLGWTRSGL